MNLYQAGMILFKIKAAVRLVGVLLLSPAVARADVPLEQIRQQASGLIKDAEFDSLFKEADLTTRYITALDGLEAKLAAAGNLDAIVRLREEREAVKQSGATTAHADREIVELRQKYQAALKVIRDGLAATKAKVAADVSQKLRAEETALTLAKKVDEALALRKEGERLLLELAASTPAAAEVPFEEDPRSKGPSETKELRAIVVPKEQPAVNDAVFSTKGRWIDSVTVPAMKQRLRQQLVIGSRGEKAWPLVVVSPGSTWSALGDVVNIELSAGRLVANGSQFANLNLLADLGSVYYFVGCSLDNCAFGKGGVWYGSDQAGKFYFDRSHVKGRFAKELNIVNEGIRAQFSVFEGIDFPSMRFFKSQPANYVNNAWMRIVNCRFVKCELPASFLTLTKDCVFENCTFIDDKDPGNDAQITKPMEINLYTSDCKMKIAKSSPQLKFVVKPVTALSGVTVPTVESLASRVSP